LNAPPLVFDVKGNSLEDGPGIRSVIFFKGCPLDCSWCQNPEGKRVAADLWWEPERCVKDGGCMEVCPRGAISPDNPFFVDRERWDDCFRCVDACPSTALRRAGRTAAPEEIVRQVLRYRAYFESTGGGVTLSGGEPTLALGFVGELLKQLKRERLHTLLQTCGLFPFAAFESDVLPWLDAVHFDLKLMDPVLHRRHCGADNRVILENFVALLERSRSSGLELLLRTPLIPGITDTEANLKGIAGFLRAHGVERAVLLPNNPVWLEKRARLGLPVTRALEQRLGSFYEPERLAELKALFAAHGVAATIG
jgi:pyruvate formate lyase activating enzyme